MLFSQRLRSIRNAMNLNQKEFASLLEINPVTLSHYENGKREPDLERLFMLCQRLKVSADYLLGLVDSIEAPNTIPVSIAKSTVQRDPLAGLSPKDRDAVLQIIAGLPKTYADTSLEEDVPIEALGFEF